MNFLEELHFISSLRLCAFSSCPLYSSSLSDLWPHPCLWASGPLLFLFHSVSWLLTSPGESYRMKNTAGCHQTRRCVFSACPRVRVLRSLGLRTHPGSIFGRFYRPPCAGTEGQIISGCEGDVSRTYPLILSRGEKGAWSKLSVLWHGFCSLLSQS